MFNDLIGKNKELGKFLFCERYTLQPVKNSLRIAEGQELKRGAVVDVNGYLIGTKSIVPYAVLEFDCDTREGGKQASVFTMGEFNFDKLTFGEGMSKNDIDNIVYNGNKVGIVIKPYEYEEGFSPAMAPSSTSEENPLMTAVETERMIDAMKPIDDMTLRFEFSKKDYNPETAGVGSAGTWTKVDSPTLNVWDWTNEATDWHESFMGAFPDADNEVSIIAAGDTSSVTKTENMFAGVFANKPSGNTYALTERNNVIKCVAFDVSNISKMNYMFTASNLKSVVHFDFSNNNSNCECDFLFADTLIEEVGDMSFKVKWLEGVFARCNLLKKVGIITIDENVFSSTSNLALFIRCENLEEIGGVSGTSNNKKFQNLFSSCHKLKIIKNPIDCSSATDMTAMFNQCIALEKIPVLTNLGNSDVTTIYAMFSNCKALTEIPLFDTSRVEDARAFINNCYNLEAIPDYDFSSVTNVQYFVSSSYKVKYGILETYNKFLARGTSITNHTNCFKDCGRDTPEGRAALAQIPASWGGLAEG